MQLTTVVLSALALLSGARALTLNTPVDAISDEPLEVSWEFDPEDPNFSLALANPTISDVLLVLVADVAPSNDAVVVHLPVVPTGPAA